MMENCTARHCENSTSTSNFSSINANFSTTNDSVATNSVNSSLVDELKLGFQVLITLLGVVGNALVLIVLRKLKSKKSITDFYVQNLAIADLGILLLSFPLVAVRERAPFGWPFGGFVCRFLYPIPEIFHAASVWCIAAIAIERHRKISTRRRHHQNHFSCQNRFGKTSLKRNVIVSSCLWLASFLMSSFPLYFVVEYRELQRGRRWCGPVWPAWDHEWVLARSYIALLTVFSYIVPLIVISWTYLAISGSLHRSNAFLRGIGKADDKDCCSLRNKNVRLRQNKRARKILTPIVVVFAITMLPLSIFRIIVVAWTEIAIQNYYENLLYVVTVFVMLNSSANPVIYSVASKDFRRSIKKLLRSRRVCQKDWFSLLEIISEPWNITISVWFCKLYLVIDR